MNIHEPYLGSGAKPQFKRGSSEYGCLCIHGFSAAPTEISWLADHLHDSLNMTTYTVRLAGHGVDPHHMRRMHWQDWYASVVDGYEILAQQCDKVFVAGISMGGLLSLLLLASQYSAPTAAAVFAAPVEYIDERRIANTRWQKYFRRMNDMPDLTDLPNVIREEQTRRGEEVIGRTHYDLWSLQAIAQLYELTLEVRQQLHHITAPLALLYAEQDKTVSLASIDSIKAKVQSERVETHIMKNGGHIITQDVDRDIAFATVEQFFQSFLIGETA